MNIFYIYFWGLICHVAKKNDPATKTHACLVNAPGSHRATLYFGLDDFEHLNPPPPGHAVKFKHGNGQATADQTFVHVPSLRQILDNGTGLTDAKQPVYDKQEPDLHVDYPKVSQSGEVKLFATTLYEKRGRHQVLGGPSMPARPVAQLVVAVIKTDHSELVLQFNGHERRKLTVESPCMVVANVEPSRDPKRKDCDPSNNHFLFYSQLLHDTNRAIACDDAPHDINVAFQGCPWVLDLVRRARRKMIEAATSTECGNTQWP